MNIGIGVINFDNITFAQIDSALGEYESHKNKPSETLMTICEAIIIGFGKDRIKSNEIQYLVNRVCKIVDESAL